MEQGQITQAAIRLAQKFQFNNGNGEGPKATLGVFYNYVACRIPLAYSHLEKMAM